MTTPSRPPGADGPAEQAAASPAPALAADALQTQADPSAADTGGAAVEAPPEDAALLDAAPPPDRRAEMSLVECVRRLLMVNGASYSAGAVQDLADLSGEGFTPRDAVSSLSNTGFVSSWGPLAVGDITAGHLPMIALRHDGSAVLVTDLSGRKGFTVQDPAREFAKEVMPRDAFAAMYSGYSVIALRKPEIKDQASRKNWFWGSLSTGKWLYGQVILAAAVSNFLGLATSLFIMVVYDRVVPNEAIESLIVLTIGVLVAVGFDFLIKSLRASFIDRAGQRADLRMSRLIFDKLLGMKLDSRSQKSGALASVVREFETLRDFFTSATLVAIVDLPFIFFFIWVISLIAGPLALVPLIAVPIVMITGLAIQPLLARIAAGAMETGMSKQAVLIETLNGLETVRATGSGRLMRKRFEEATASQSELGLKNRILSQFAINSAATVQQLAQVMTIFYGVFLIADGTITMGALIAAVILGGRTLAPLGQIASALSRANNARQAFRSINQLMQQDDTEADEGQRLSRPHLKGDIEFKNVTYSFPGANAPIIRDLSIKIPAGQKVAILGRMGSGKSTLARLASGLLTPSEGSVLIDGVDLRQIDKSDLRRNLGVMLQETWLFSGTLRENLQMGYFEYDDQHLLTVARISGVDDFVAGHPQGYDLPVRERGEGLSGGQRQSINLARALLHEPNALVLDEPTSSMDSATEAAIIERLKFWLRNRTLVMVTHRNSLLALADRVLVMDKGAVIADTTPDQLRAAEQRKRQ